MSSGLNVLRQCELKVIQRLNLPQCDGGKKEVEDDNYDVVYRGSFVPGKSVAEFQKCPLPSNRGF